MGNFHKVNEALEVNFDGLVGPTHNYAGLSFGNVASLANQHAASNPQEGALQGLEKMHGVGSLGLTQALIPPQERPAISALKRLGFEGDDTTVLQRAAQRAPHLLAACTSASSMWTANAATIAPSMDSGDGRLQLTPANLSCTFHRSIEPVQTARTLKAIFAGDKCFKHHLPLPAGAAFGDEGAANHTRLCPSHAASGLHVFVYGRDALDGAVSAPRRYPARQTREACEAVARLHRIPAERTVFLPQSPAAIDAGVFHNDVISVGNENVLLYHEQAFEDSTSAVDLLRDRYRSLYEQELCVLPVLAADVSLEEAVSTYLFNSQVLTLRDGRMLILAPSECRERPVVARYFERLVNDDANPVGEVRYLDLRQSMRNGGGPACLRLRVVVTREELGAVSPGVFVDDGRYRLLVEWVRRHYRDRLRSEDLADPALLNESRQALDELSAMLGLGSIYEFQLAGGDGR